MTQVINLVEESRIQISKLSDRVGSLEDKIGSLGILLEQIGNRPQQPIFSNESSTSSSGFPTVIFTQQEAPPVFDPVKKFGSGRYLEELEAYFSKRNTPEGKKLEIALEGLQGHAKNWATICKTTWANFEDFKASFQNYFWSAQEQGRVRQQINNGKWTEGTSLSEHFAYIASLANLLTTPIPEITLVEEIMRHFPTHIQALWSLKPAHSLNDAMAFLKQQEDLGNYATKRNEAVAHKAPRHAAEFPRYNPYSYRKSSNPKPGPSKPTYPINVLQADQNQGNAQWSS